MNRMNKSINLDIIKRQTLNSKYQMNNHLLR